MRATRSEPEPTPNGTTNVIGRDGKLCADAVTAPIPMAVAASNVSGKQIAVAPNMASPLVDRHCSISY